MRPPSRKTADAAHAFGADLSGTQNQPEKPLTQGLSISSQKPAHHASQPGVVHGHYLYPHAARLFVSGRHHVLAQPQGAELAAVQYHGRWVLH